jgi:hypothetical protein
MPRAGVIRADISKAGDKKFFHLFIFIVFNRADVIRQ